MNWHKKKDSKDKILHDTFTAYLTTAIHRRRLLYIEQQMRTQKADICLEHTQPDFPELLRCCVGSALFSQTHGRNYTLW